MRNAITKEQVQNLQSTQKVTMIDIRSMAEYEKQHIPGVRNIPVEDLPGEIGVISKEDTIVCICNHGKERSQKAAELLYNSGCMNTFYLEGGTAGWYL